MMHYIPCDDMNTKWDIITRNEIITTSRVCKSYSVEICGRELRANMLVIDTGGYNVILGMTRRNKYHAVTDCRNKSVIFRIPHQPVYQFVGESRRPDRSSKGLCHYRSSGEGVLVVEEFLDVFSEDLPGFSSDRDMESAINVIPSTVPIPKAPIGWRLWS